MEEEKKYDITYKCGCVHELVEKDFKDGGGMHRPTGKQTHCAEHTPKAETS